MISGFDYNWTPIRIPCSTMSLDLLVRCLQVIVIDPFDIDVGICSLIVLDKNYFPLILVSFRIMFSLIRVDFKQGE